MGSYLEKKEVKKALEEAKRLGAEPSVSVEEIVRTYEADLAKTAKTQKFLKPAWFVKDLHGSSRKKAKK